MKQISNLAFETAQRLIISRIVDLTEDNKLLESDLNTEQSLLFLEEMNKLIVSASEYQINFWDILKICNQYAFTKILMKHRHAKRLNEKSSRT